MVLTVLKYLLDSSSWSIVHRQERRIALPSPLIANYGLTWPIGAPIEDTISATQLIFKSIPVRYPRIKIINSHLGGALPMLLQRLDNQYRWAAPQMTEPPSTQARRMWYDTVGHFHVPALRLRVVRR